MKTGRQRTVKSAAVLVAGDGPYLSVATSILGVPILDELSGFEFADVTGWLLPMASLGRPAAV